MSGVLVNRFGRKTSASAGSESSVKYSVSSCLLFRQVKYVYDCVKPSFARRYMILGRVKASERKIASGRARFTSARHHSQTPNGLVCGLSTRKMRTPCSTQKRKTLFSSSHRDRQSSQPKSNG